MACMKELQRYAILAAAVAVALLAAGCATAPGDGNRAANNTSVAVDPPLVGTWQLTSFLGADGETVEAVAGSTPLVSFDRDGRVTGSVGCNQFSADYTTSGSQLSIGPAVSTLMYCSFPAGVMDQESRVLELLPLTAGYTVAGDTLTILDRAGTEIMKFNRAAGPEDAPLVGTTWRLAGFSDNATARSALEGSNATVVFGADGRLTGTTGCNDLSGPYTTNDARIAIGPLAVTERACADPALMLQERELLEALEIAATYDIEGDRLTMIDPSATQMVEFVALD
jgi:heat shock protein HslJ